MFQKLQPSEYARVRPLFQGFNDSLSIRAAIEGYNPGHIFVDDAAQPRTALALTVEGTLLAGDDGNPATNAALRRLFEEQIFTGQVFLEDDWSMTVAVHPDTWVAKLPELIPTHEADKLPRYHYLCRELRFDWREHVPEGYTVRRIDRALLDDPAITLTAAIQEWIPLGHSWGSVENFLAHGVGFCVLHGHEVVSRCMADCRAGDQIDVGAITDPAHRRKGLGAIAVAATVDHCLNNGFAQVGWHCEQDNVRSWKTAEKVGFQRAGEYVYYYYIFDPVDHLAQLGWSCFKREEYERTAQYYEQVFARRDENPHYYYHLAAATWAALGNRDLAFQYLHAAVDRGWTSLKGTTGTDEFRSLHGTPEWEAVLDRMWPGVPG